MIIAGNKIYDQCSDCQKLVQINKFIIGGVHICLTDEERMMREYVKNQIKQQENFIKRNNK